MPEATKPLVAQIAQLQQQAASKEETLASVRSSLTLQVRDLESKVRQYQRQEKAQQQLLRDGADKMNDLLADKGELESRVTDLEQQLQAARDEGASHMAGSAQANGAGVPTSPSLGIPYGEPPGVTGSGSMTTPLP